MNKTDEKKRAEFYLRVSKILREASIKMGLRYALGYVFTSEERKAILDIQQIFFPEQETSMDVDYTIICMQYAYDALAKTQVKASECIECRECEKNCPQRLRIPDYLKDVRKAFEAVETK